MINNTILLLSANIPTVEELLQWSVQIQAVLTYLFTRFLSNVKPIAWFTKDDNRLKFLVMGGLIAMMFICFGFSSVSDVVITFLLTGLGYQLTVEPLAEKHPNLKVLKTPKLNKAV